MSDYINFNNSNASLVDKLFPSSQTAGTTGLLGDYASLRNGSYKKLLNAYYDHKEDLKIENTNANLSMAGVGTAKDVAGQLKEAASELLDKDSDIFKKEDGAYDKDKIYEAVKGFADSYNALMKSAETIDDEKTLEKILNLAQYTSSNRTALSYSAISFNEDSEMVVDKEKFQKMDMEAVKGLFQGAGSFASQIMLKAENVSSAATVAIAKASGTYGSTGSYDKYLETGSRYKDLV